MSKIRSAIPGVLWPGMPSLKGAHLLAMQHQFDESQWWSGETLHLYQFQQLQQLLRHASQTVPFYRERLKRADINLDEPLALEAWERIPLLSREDLRLRNQDLLSQHIPAQHGRPRQNSTSGTSGEPIKVASTELNSFFWQALTLRDHHWHKRDSQGCLVVIRSGRSQKDPFAVYNRPNWGPPVNLVYQTGPMTVFFHRTPIARQAELLVERNPDYLLAYPSNVLFLAQYFQDRNLSLNNLKEIRTYGEPITPASRKACKDVWGIEISDVYSCEEVGYIALQCPEHNNYHIQSEAVLVEVLDGDGRICGPNQPGRVVLTSLHNFAMPLIRYEIGDFAEVGRPCPCGRGLPVLNRIYGRERNRAVLPDGRVIWPVFTEDVWPKIPDLLQAQLVQREPSQFEVRVAIRRPLTLLEQEQFASAVKDLLNAEVKLSIKEIDDIPCHPNGKFETFYSEVSS